MNETEYSNQFENGNIRNDTAIYETVKSIVFDAVFENVTVPFDYDKNSDAFRFGFLCSVCQQSIGLSFKDIEQILNRYR